MQQVSKYDKITNSKVFNIVLISFFAALTAVFSQIAIPMVPVPLNLALISVFICSGILSVSKSLTSVAIYILLGVVGIPVFAKFNSGVGTLLGPTGGYIIGYLFTALTIGLILKFAKNKVHFIVLALVLGTIVCYAFGTLWYCVSTNTALLPALTACVFPFILGDILKIIVSTIIIQKLKKHIFYN